MNAAPALFLPGARGLAPEQFVEGIRSGDRRVLSRFITLLESRLVDDRRLAQRVLTALLPHTGRSIRVGITGVPGAGKSTLIESLGLTLTGQGHRVAVLTIDPTSRISGGSILGDKTRMIDLSRDPNAFIRPSPSGETLGGVARATREVMLTCEAAGFDVILIETVGVGQSETVVADMVDFFLVVLIAGAGDELQGIKRGLMEMADLVAINKADGDNRVHAERARALYQNAMRLIHPADGPWTPPVLTCSAVDKTGIDHIWSQVLEFRAQFEPTGWFDQHRREQLVRWMWDLVNENIDGLLHRTPDVRAISSRVEAAIRSGSMTAADGAETVLRAIDQASRAQDSCCSQERRPHDSMRPRAIPVESILALAPACLRMTVPEEYRDENGHMNVRWYAAIFDEAGDAVHVGLGLTPEFLQEHQSGTMDLESHFNFLHEVMIGDHLAIFARLVAFSAKRVHYLLFMINETRGNVSAICECVNSYVDLTVRKTASFPSEIVARIQAEVDASAALDWAPPLCGVLGA